VRPTSTNRATGDRAVRQQIRFFQNEAAFSLDKRQPQADDAGMLREFAFISRNDRLAKHRLTHQRNRHGATSLATVAKGVCLHHEHYLTS
jgi:hypothetical protein